MARISNLVKAHEQINEQSIKYEGLLTMPVFMGFFESAIKEFNLDEAKVAELKALKFSRKIDEEESIIEPENQAEPLTTEQKIEAMQAEIDSLKCCLSEIATLTGYANYLAKYNMKRTEPVKKK